MTIYLPSLGPASWQALLAKPDLHWVKGYSARTLAYAWEAANGLPSEVAAVLEPTLGALELLIAIPEHKVPLPGGRRESQCDVFALLRAADQIVSLAVEGKVDEPFGPTVGEWLLNGSEGKQVRLESILTHLGLTGVDPSVRYQLLHRTAAAVIEADRFRASAAAMVVHSFSPEARWFEDYERFVALFGASANKERAAAVNLPSGTALYLGWAAGDQRFRSM